MTDDSQPQIGNTSSAIVVDRYKDLEGNWRTRIRSVRGKFDDAAKERFLAEYRIHGRMGDSARAAGVSPKTVNTHMAKDEEFAEACLEAEEEYRSKLVAHQQDLVFNGTVKKTYDRNGNVVSEEQIYPIPLIQMELRKHDEGYRDKREVDMNVRGGVLVAPAEVGSIEDWESKYADDKTIEGEVVSREES